MANTIAWCHISHYWLDRTWPQTDARSTTNLNGLNLNRLKNCLDRCGIKSRPHMAGPPNHTTTPIYVTGLARPRTKECSVWTDITTVRPAHYGARILHSCRLSPQPSNHSPAVYTLHRRPHFPSASLCVRVHKGASRTPHYKHVLMNGRRILSQCVHNSPELLSEWQLHLRHYSPFPTTYCTVQHVNLDPSLHHTS
jgi:hypothetical protein